MQADCEAIVGIGVAESMRLSVVRLAVTQKSLVQIEPLQPKFLLFQQLPQTLQPSEFVSKSAVLNSLTSPSSQRTDDHAITGHAVWSTTFIRSSFIRPPYTSILERAVSISRRSAGVS